MNLPFLFFYVASLFILTACFLRPRIIQSPIKYYHFLIFALFFIFSHGFSGHDMDRYLPWIVRLKTDPSVINVWAENEFLVGFISYSFIQIFGLISPESTLYFVRFVYFALLPLSVTIFLSQSQFPNLLSPRQVYISLIFIFIMPATFLGVSNIILQGFTIVPLFFVLFTVCCSYDNGPFSIKRVNCINHLFLIFCFSIVSIVTHTSALIFLFPLYLLASIPLSINIVPMRLISRINTFKFSLSSLFYFIAFLLLPPFLLSFTSKFSLSRDSSSAVLYFANSIILLFLSYWIIRKSFPTHIPAHFYVLFNFLLSLVYLQFIILPVGVLSTRVGFFSIIPFTIILFSSSYSTSIVSISVLRLTFLYLLSYSFLFILTPAFSMLLG